MRRALLAATLVLAAALPAPAPGAGEDAGARAAEDATLADTASSPVTGARWRVHKTSDASWVTDGERVFATLREA